MAIFIELYQESEQGSLVSLDGWSDRISLTREYGNGGGGERQSEPHLMGWLSKNLFHFRTLEKNSSENIPHFLIQFLLLFSYFASRENSYYLFPPYHYYLSSVCKNILNGKDGSIRMDGNKILA